MKVKEMKKIYIKPVMLATNIEMESGILAGSVQPSADISAKSDGENITVSDKQKPDITDVDYAKKHNAWSSWDD